MGARIAVVEMPPGPPVLQTVVAEVHGPDAETRRQVAADLATMFEKVPNVVDVDTYMADPYEYWRFEVDTEKAVRRGISVDTINNTLAMAMGNYKLGDVKRGTVLEPTYIVIQVPLSIRSQITRLGDLPVPTNDGRTLPLSELGQFVKQNEDPIIYSKDLRGIEYVVGEMEGRLGAPIYGMLGIEDLVKNYTTPDGVTMVTMPWNLFGAPKDDSVSGYEWSGEWTVTYETFRDMGGAFMAALVLVYALIVWEFRNFAISGLIMAPIPLTMIGIIPGHWILGAEFTATSMIGMIALSGIIVRQSILIVEFVKIGVSQGMDVKEAAIRGTEVRMRPIFITSLTTMAGASTILSDPIFQGLAVSTLFGAATGTVLALLVIPLGCISARRQFYVETRDDGTMGISPAYERMEKVSTVEASDSPAASTPLWMRLYGGIVSVFTWIFYIIRAVFTMLGMGFKAMFGGFGRRGGTPPPPRQPTPGGTPPPPRGGTPPPPRQAPPAPPAPSAGAAEPVTSAAASEPVVEPAPVQTEAAAAAPAAVSAETMPEPPKVAQTAVTTDANHSEEDADEDSVSSADMANEDGEGIVRKRRGIRLKQDLN